MDSEGVPSPDKRRRRFLSTRGPAETPADGDRWAAVRDNLADERDRRAEARDRRASQLDALDAQLEAHRGRDELRAAAELARRRAAADRARAANDRQQAARDRRHAARDRRRAWRDRELAEIDELTGVRRRGSGLAALQSEVDRAQRSGESLVVAYVDVDGLKAVNDEQGHGAGDQVLRDVAEGLRRHLRSYDLVLRLGGDEFVCGMPGATLEEARGRFAQLAAELSDGENKRSVSIGLTELEAEDSSQTMVERADHELLAERARQAVFSPAARGN